MMQMSEKLKSDLRMARLALSDEQKLQASELFEVWDIDREYPQGEYISYQLRLFKCRQTHTSQEIYPPPLIPAIWEEISFEEGTREHPIHYNNNMELFADKCYSQFDVTYLCTRNTGVPVYNDLKDLVGIYVQEISND